MARFRQALVDLGLALVNATLLLALALALVVWQITARLDHLAGVTVERLAARLVLPDLAPRIERIEARLDTASGAELLAETRALREDLAALRSEIDPRAVGGHWLGRSSMKPSGACPQHLRAERITRSWYRVRLDQVD